MTLEESLHNAALTGLLHFRQVEIKARGIRRINAMSDKLRSLRDHIFSCIDDLYNYYHRNQCSYGTGKNQKIAAKGNLICCGSRPPLKT